MMNRLDSLTMTPSHELETSPILIQMDQPVGSKVFLFPLPTAKVVEDDAPGIGKVRMALGGPTWDIANEIVDSIADVVPDPATGAVNFNRAAPADFLQTGTVMVVSKRFRSVVEPHLRNVEFLPLALNTTPPGKGFGSGEISGEYFWMNSWNRLDLVDQDASAFGQGIDPVTKTFSAWKMLVLKPLPADAGIFGLKGLMGGRRFISPQLHEILIKEGLNMEFSPVLLDESDPITADTQRFNYRTQLNK